MTRPFSGIRILDFTQVFAGPLASYQLSLLGADVIKVERRGGEDMRGRPRSADGTSQHTTPGWIAINANKRNIALDLKNPEAVEIIKRLVVGTDVVMENFRPGVMDRLGIGYEDLSAINQGLIYCCVSGFGREGPLKDEPSYDGKIQAMSGIMSVTGHEETGPMRAGFAICDATAGITAAFGVASALYQRTHTGKGQLVDVAMYDSALALQSPGIADYTIAGKEHKPYGNRAISGLPTADLFPVKDGNILLAVNNEKQFRCLMRSIGREALLDDPRFVDWPARLKNEDALIGIIREVFAEDDAATWETRLIEEGVPCARIQSIKQAVTHPQLDHRDFMQTIEGPDGSVTLATTGFRLEHGNAFLEHSFAKLGEHSEDILGEAGFSEEEITRLRDNGTI
ncbi:MAG: CoA transferase [Pseudomonadales bacterium]|jgi:crotonobetainyl-CoA:carnitine CoA-transferase CaiB-like acyl-CoA transferase|nr:CoA transferase [Pseudomonadales bacterium]MDP6472544.1 CoA transferase [Pseudomonadales bacterium]MDP6829026.1 CoA transferase [Pseudomonadales bacterium]MDP6969920.1 CoA transferase [Pseudomonadales bacterium]|tara:strand:- start:2137 stop:3330 length:1194 start_codon:yes stop_codon:yes gene_type:complete